MPLFYNNFKFKNGRKSNSFGILEDHMEKTLLLITRNI